MWLAFTSHGKTCTSKIERSSSRRCAASSSVERRAAVPACWAAIRLVRTKQAATEVSVLAMITSLRMCQDNESLKMSWDTTKLRLEARDSQAPSERSASILLDERRFLTHCRSPQNLWLRTLVSKLNQNCLANRSSCAPRLLRKELQKPVQTRLSGAV